MRAAVLPVITFAILAASFLCPPASAGSQPQAASSGAVVVVKYPDGHCGISLVKQNDLNTAKQRGAEVISEAYRNGADATKKLRELKAGGVCK